MKVRKLKHRKHDAFFRLMRSTAPRSTRGQLWALADKVRYIRTQMSAALSQSRRGVLPPAARAELARSIMTDWLRDLGHDAEVMTGVDERGEPVLHVKLPPMSFPDNIQI